MFLCINKKHFFILLIFHVCTCLKILKFSEKIVNEYNDYIEINNNIVEEEKNSFLCYKQINKQE